MLLELPQIAPERWEFGIATLCARLSQSWGVPRAGEPVRERGKGESMSLIST
jgi:hypothetical protein